MELEHGRGILTIEGHEVVNQERGKNLITRKQWARAERIGVDEVQRILIKSRDRVVSELDPSIPMTSGTRDPNRTRRCARLACVSLGLTAARDRLVRDG